jgi:hypothetical protein
VRFNELPELRHGRKNCAARAAYDVFIIRWGFGINNRLSGTVGTSEFFGHGISQQRPYSLRHAPYPTLPSGGESRDGASQKTDEAVKTFPRPATDDRACSVAWRCSPRTAPFRLDAGGIVHRHGFPSSQNQRGRQVSHGNFRQSDGHLFASLMMLAWGVASDSITRHSATLPREQSAIIRCSSSFSLRRPSIRRSTSPSLARAIASTAAHD